MHAGFIHGSAERGGKALVAFEGSQNTPLRQQLLRVLVQLPRGHPRLYPFRHAVKNIVQNFPALTEEVNFGWGFEANGRFWHKGKLELKKIFVDFL